MSLTIQYIIIAIIFIMAVYTLIRKFWPNKSKSQSGCGQGCGCELTKKNANNI
ncbi:MAG: FeoB-associated Cys-rich membrane protein [Sphingobacterium composti]|uniref:FeoB-associated Cys-rich membrane protein n=1 Tax=Sphingobacterium composti TaxID=363260 RepID=UPI001356FAD9|nr:FeoB-associated Cys-rich membrane protein [Sphingobacterium composti Ten et al. 2007 non Yoo et al. 2007]